jgi:hypothetical protein
VVNTYLDGGRVEEAEVVARRALDMAIELETNRGMCHYYLAQVQAVAGRTDPGAIPEAAKQLVRAFAANSFFREYYRGDPRFNLVRSRLEAELPRAEAAARAWAEVHRRKASAPVAQLTTALRAPRAASNRLIPQDEQPE